MSLRFGKMVLASGAGLVVDILLALLLRHRLGLPLPMAGAVSFITVAAVNYVLFEYLVFCSEHSRLNWARLVKVLATSGVSLVFRVGAVSALVLAIGPVRSWLIDTAVLVAASGLSLIANYLMLRTFVFRDR